MCCKLHSKTFADCARHQIEQGVVADRFVLEQITDKAPSARGSECPATGFRIEVVHVLLGERQITHYVLVDALVDSPCLPRSEVGTHFQVKETISKGHRHAICHALVAVTIACCDDHNIVRQTILADATIQNQLIACSLHRGRGRVHFIKEENNDGILRGEFLVGQIDRGSPIHLAVVFVEERDAANVSRLHLRHTQINDCAAKFVADFCDNIRFADAGRAPEKDGTLDLERNEHRLTGLNAGDRETV